MDIGKHLRGEMVNAPYYDSGYALGGRYTVAPRNVVQKAVITDSPISLIVDIMNVAYSSMETYDEPW